jgi:hypothetical protein
MRTIAADWSVSGYEQGGRRSWVSSIGARLRNVGSARAVGRQAGEAASAPLSGRGSHEPYVQADVAAFISAFMRIG